MESVPDLLKRHYLQIFAVIYKYSGVNIKLSELTDGAVMALLASEMDPVPCRAG